MPILLHGPGFVYADVAAPGGYGRLIRAEECVDSGLIYLGLVYEIRDKKINLKH